MSRARAPRARAIGGRFLCLLFARRRRFSASSRRYPRTHRALTPPRPLPASPLPSFSPRPPPTTKHHEKNNSALVALLALVFLAAPASAARSLKQVDSSIRQETARDRIIAKLRRGKSAEQASTATRVFGKGNFERK